MGIARPRVVMSRSIVNALSEEELSVVLSHEGAHLSAFDNLKRLCILLAPGSGALERAWMGCAEYAADRQAVRGDIRRSLALASALVRVARFARTHELSPVATSFFANESNISARVDRLLAEVPSVEPAPRGGRYRFAAALAFIGIVFQPATLRLVHSLLERFVR
jgi:Zn-dependent protease with chaperone function